MPVARPTTATPPALDLATGSAQRRPTSLRLQAPAALCVGAALLMPLMAQAQSSGATVEAGKNADAKPTELPAVKAKAKVIDPNPNAQTGVPYKARTSGDARHTRPLAETPQTINVITQEAIQDSGASALREILDGQPGITLGTGENGNAFGDRYIIRGQEARSDVFVDGLRDPGMTTRESFAVEQLEISKGPNSSFAGRGTAGGAINAITKQATLDYDFGRATLGIGSDRYTRATVDVNHIFSDQLAVRVNALHADEDVPGRSPASRQRSGVAVSALYEFAPDRTLTLDYYGLRANDLPDLGSWLQGTVPNRTPQANAPVYAQTADFLDSKVDTVTARLQWRLNPAMNIDSRTRFGQSTNGYVATGARGTTAYDSTGTAYATAVLSTHQGWQDVEYFAHQTNLRWDTQLAGMKHEWIFGVELTDHKVLNGVYSITNGGAYNCMSNTTVTANNAWCAIDANGQAVSGLNTLLGRSVTQGTWDSDWHIRTLSLSAMDTVDLTPKLSAFAGVRADRFDYKLRTQVVSTGVQADYDYADTLMNGHLGLTYKLNKQGMVYASVASSSDINGGESDVGTNSGYGGAIILNGEIAGAKPETSVNLEVGTKWNLLDERLLATAAIFQTTKRDVMEGNGYTSTGTYNSGRNRVRGIELGLTGELTDQLSVQAGLTWMKSRVMQSATAAYVGLPLSNFAERSAQVQLKYKPTERVSVGGAARYESERCAGQPDTAAGYNTDGLCNQPVPAYTVLDLFASYRFNRQLEARVNLLNAGDKDYYLAAYRSGAFLYKGDARALRVTLAYDF